MPNFQAFKEAVLQSETYLKGGNKQEAFRIMKEYHEEDPEIELTEEFLNMAVSPLGIFIAKYHEEEWNSGRRKTGGAT